ncbi:MAG: DNA mismatch repair endonuclease MutH [Myxococcota bacterium]
MSLTELGEASEPPATEDELRARVDALTGRTLGEVAAALGEEVPEDLRRKKGWVGNLLEQALHTSAGNRAAPDFVELGIELKTLPVDATGKPLESTYVTTVPLEDVEELGFEDSKVLAKLEKVLWVPIHAEGPLAERMIGRAVLWSPDDGEREALRSDWESHIQTIRQGFVENINARDGEVLQIRPKAANSSSLTWGVDPHGESILTGPRGFYLRTVFTEYLLKSRLFGVGGVEPDDE